MGREPSRGLARAARLLALTGVTLAASGRVSAQTRVAILQAEDRRGQTPADLALLRSGSRSDDPQTRRVAIRALGRLEHPLLIPDLVPGLKHELPEIRSEAANAVAQAARGLGASGPGTLAELRAVAGAVDALTARLAVEPEAEVRAAICESIGQLPYSTSEAVERAERTLLTAAAKSATVVDRLGVAKGLEALLRLTSKVRAPGPDAIALLREYASQGRAESARGARVRRLAIEALITAHAVDEATLIFALKDPDPQVRRNGIRAAAGAAAQTDAGAAALRAGLLDASPLVRVEAVRTIRDCGAARSAADDKDLRVALVALDQLARCGDSSDAVALLERALDDAPDLTAARGWHRAAHALVALASAAPDRAAVRLPAFASARVWQLRLYAARAAMTLRERPTLEALASNDADDNVREAALDGLAKVAGHDADAVYVANLARPGYQVIRAAALALADTPHLDAAAPALTVTLRRLVDEGRDNSHDARDAVAQALHHSDRRTSEGRRPIAPASNGMTAEELRRLASPRARITIRDVGTFELALFTSEAPATVLRFAHLAESGYYNGLTFHRVVPDFVIQGGSPGANEYIGDASFMRDEVGLWPHVRGAAGISTRGHDTGDAQIFIDLVDNPRLDHVYTVFAQVLNGIDVVDRILEGDVIDRIEIIP
jgi:cyclophilin family peptidyl-prolyl cis-trans isomerase/HEAT repeat protein